MCSFTWGAGWPEITLTRLAGSGKLNTGFRITLLLRSGILVACYNFGHSMLARHDHQPDGVFTHLCV